MRSFYAGIAAGLPPDQALRLSQLQMIRASGELAAPRASFQVAGEARHPVWEPRQTPTTCMVLTLALIAGIVVFLTL